jgi:hypothetical protein
MTQISISYHISFLSFPVSSNLIQFNDICVILMDFFGGNIKRRKKEKNVTNEEFVFILYNIDLHNDGLVKSKKEEKIIERQIKVSELEIKPMKTIINRDNIFQYVTMVDVINSPIPKSTNIPCMGCHRKYKSCPLGVPVKYVPSVLNTVVNDISYSKNLTSREFKKMKTDVEYRDKIVDNDYFITDSIVCSFNCMITVFNERPEIYRETPLLINEMYKRVFGNYPLAKITKAPSWRLRKEYGGPLSDEEFESSLQTINFIDTGQLRTKLAGRIFDVHNT